MFSKISRIKILVSITLVSILASVLISIFIMQMFVGETDALTLSISVIAPAIIAPSVSWYIVDLTVQIQKLEKEQRNLATYDMLTGLLTRRVFLSNFETLLHLETRNRGLLALAYIDIDDFKKINDKYGHAGGDAVLASFGKKLRKSIRKSDLVGRIGGEEFAVVLPDTDLQGSLHVLEKISFLVKTTPVSFSEQRIQYTVSIGVTIFDKQNRVDLEKLLIQADDALYDAKRSGKDCIIEYSESDKQTRLAG